MVNKSSKSNNLQVKIDLTTETKKNEDLTLSNFPSCSLLLNKKQNEDFAAPLPIIPHSKTKSQMRKAEIKDLNLQLPEVQECDIKFSDTILGSGAQGIVRKATWVGTIVAVKTIKKANSSMLTLREIKMLERIRHHNFINVMAFSSTEKDYHIVLEFFNGQSLQELIFNGNKIFELDTLKKNSISLQICDAINFIHSQKVPILHRDIKPGNVMINKNCIVKVCDLGLSKSDDLDKNLMTTTDGVVRGTVMFLAPELLLFREKPTTKSDVWAVACTLVELYNEKNVWDVNCWTMYEDVKKNLKDKKVPDTATFPSFVSKSIKRCFDYDKMTRSNIIDILEKYRKAKNVVGYKFFDY